MGTSFLGFRFGFLHSQYLQPLSWSNFFFGFQTGTSSKVGWYIGVERFTTQRRHVCITGENAPGWYTVRTLTCFVSHLGYTNNTPPWPFGKPSGCLGISKELWVCYANPLFNGKFVNTNTYLVWGTRSL